MEEVAATTPVWEGAPPVDLPALVGEVDADVCVVGLGTAGLAAARRSLARGLDTVGVDAGPVGGGASGRNGGFLLAGAARFHHDAVREYGRERAAAIHRATLEELGRLESELPDLVRRVGSLRIAASDDELADCETHLVALRADGFPAERYDGPEGRGILLPDDGAVDPAARVAAEARAVLDGGARLSAHSPAVAVGNGRVTTPVGAVACQHVVVAVDGCLEHVVPELAGRVRTARAQMLATAPVGPLLPRPVYLRYGYEYVLQRPDGVVALGGFRDRGGDAEWTSETTPTTAVQQLLERFLRDRLGIRAPVTHRWAGSIAFTGDGLPVVGAVRPGVVACGGYSGTGNLVGPLAGRAAVDLALDGASPLADLLRTSTGP